LKKYPAWGADLAGYGEKYFGGPNSTGILCGNKALVEAARLQSFASFETTDLLGIDRPLKIDCQKIIAVGVALREWLHAAHEARFADLEKRAANLCRAFGDVAPTKLKSTWWGPIVVLILDGHAQGKTAEEVAEILRNGNPSIWVDVAGLGLPTPCPRTPSCAVMKSPSLIDSDRYFKRASNGMGSCARGREMFGR
jgi:seryl-tRNA(Sec) selenium transferase